MFYHCKFLLALFACLAVLSPAVSGESVSSVAFRTEAGLHRAEFHVPQGTIRVNLPDDLSAGDTISGTVYTEPAGTNQAQADKNSGELSGYVIEMPGAKATPREQHFRWDVPGFLPTSSRVLLLRDLKNKIIARCPLPVNPPATDLDKGFQLPAGGQSGSVATAGVPSDAPVGTTVTVGDAPANVIAESPRKVIFQIPNSVIGPSSLKVSRGDRSATHDFYALGLELSASKRALLRGETATMVATVRGLAALKEPASLILVNRAPTVVSISGGPLQEFRITSSDIRDGVFSVTRTLTGEQGGAFDIFVSVSIPPSSRIPLQSITRRTIDSWSRSNDIAVTPEARGLIADDIAAAIPELNRLLESQAPYRADHFTLFDWMVRDYCFDLRDRTRQTPQASMYRGNVRFVSMRSFDPSPAPAPSLGQQDVKRFSFLQYLTELMSRLTPSSALANLAVSSQPDNQIIRVDRRSGMDYFTNRLFVVSVGDHDVEVAKCKQSVTLAPNQTREVSCPRQ